MARAFDSSSSQYLVYSGTMPVTAYPNAYGCRFLRHSDSAAKWAVQMYNSGEVSAYTGITPLASGDTPANGVRNQIDQSSDGFNASWAVTSAYTVDQWITALAVNVSSTERYIYLTGASRGSDTNTKGWPNGLDRLEIAASLGTAVDFDGAISDVFFLDYAPSQAEAQKIVDSRMSPLGLVRRSGLVAYWKLTRSDGNRDLIGGRTLTPVNSPGSEQHPPIIYPGGMHTTMNGTESDAPSGGGGGGGNIFRSLVIRAA